MCVCVCDFCEYGLATDLGRRQEHMDDLMGGCVDGQTARADGRT